MPLQRDLDWKKHVITDPGVFRPLDLIVSAGDAKKAHEVLDWAATTDLPAFGAKLVRS